MKVIGWLALLAGIFVALVALGMDTSISSGDRRVHNIGLMQQQQNMLLLGVGAAIIGILMVIAGRRAGSSPGASSTQAEPRRACPHCAEKLLLDAKVCRFCGRDVVTPTHSSLAAQRDDQEQMADLGITYDGKFYCYGGNQYARLADATAYANQVRASKNAI